MLIGDGWGFIHIPKCGGTAMRRCLVGVEVGSLMPLGSGCPVRSALHRIPCKRPSGRVFIVVRHPAAWLRSYWLDQSPQRIGVNRFLHQFWSADLDEFVVNVCTGRPGYVTALYKAYMRYRRIEIFRLEDGLDHVLVWLGIKLQKVPIINASPHGPHLSAASLALVAETEYPLLREFGYTP